MERRSRWFVKDVEHPHQLPNRSGWRAGSPRLSPGQGGRPNEPSEVVKTDIDQELEAGPHFLQDSDGDLGVPFARSRFSAQSETSPTTWPETSWMFFLAMATARVAGLKAGTAASVTRHLPHGLGTTPERSRGRPLRDDGWNGMTPSYCRLGSRRGCGLIQAVAVSDLHLLPRVAMEEDPPAPSSEQLAEGDIKGKTTICSARPDWYASVISGGVRHDQGARPSPAMSVLVGNHQFRVDL